jgi:hypothetical protein
MVSELQRRGVEVGEGLEIVHINDRMRNSFSIHTEKPKKISNK